MQAIYHSAPLGQESHVKYPLPFRARIPATPVWMPPAQAPKDCLSKATCSPQESKELHRILQEAGEAGCSEGQASCPGAMGLTPTQGWRYR